MSDKIYTHLTQIAQLCGRAFDVHQWSFKDFDDLFHEIMAIKSEDADEIVRYLYSYGGAYGGYVHLGEMYALKKEKITAEEQKQYDDFRGRAMQLREQIAAKLEAIEKAKKKN